MRDSCVRTRTSVHPVESTYRDLGTSGPDLRTECGPSVRRRTLVKEHHLRSQYRNVTPRRTPAVVGVAVTGVGDGVTPEGPWTRSETTQPPSRPRKRVYEGRARVRTH